MVPNKAFKKFRVKGRFLVLGGIVTLLTYSYLNKGAMYMYQKAMYIYQKAMCTYNYPIYTIVRVIMRRRRCCIPGRRIRYSVRLSLKALCGSISVRRRRGEASSSRLWIVDGGRIPKVLDEGCN